MKRKHSSCGCPNRHCSHTPEPLSDGERDVLSLLAQTPFLPAARFVMASSRSPHVRATALAPVLLTSDGDGIAEVKNRAAALSSLEERGALSIDYDTPIENCDYGVYKNSNAYSFFAETVSEGAQNPAFIFDTPELEPGSVTLTALGQELVDDMNFT